MTARPQQSAATEVTTPYMAARTTACHLISSITLIGTAGFSFLAHLCVCVMSSRSRSAFHFLTNILSVPVSQTVSSLLPHLPL